MSLSSDLHRDLAPLRSQLVRHPVFHAVDSLPKLRLFMDRHAFAVWDFMSLAKRLQVDLTCTQVPWTPPAHPELARFINEIVLEEETDRDPNGAAMSHFEMYTRAMREVGADAQPILEFVRLIAEGTDVDEALQRSEAPPSVHPFVHHTVGCATLGRSIDVAASFCLGREDVIPEMFQRLMRLWPGAESTAPMFLFYLQRHIELDGEQHGPAAARLLTTLIEQAGEGGWERARDAAAAALQSRLRLWDAVAADLARTFGTQPVVETESAH